TALPAWSWEVENKSTSTSTWSNYDSSIVIDGLGGAVRSGKKLSLNLLATLKSSGITAVHQTIPAPGDDYEKTKKAIKETKALIALHSDTLKLITSAHYIVEAKRHKQVGIIMGFQSTEMFGSHLERVKEFADAGVKIMQLSYNNRSQFGAGGLVKTKTGLTELGKQAIEQMQKHNVLVDVSHSAKQTVADAIQYSQKPISISHTGCNAIYRHPRNNDDAELRSLANKGGVVGIYLMPFLEGGEHEIKADMVIRHIEHALNVCGSDHVAIGTDQGIAAVNDTPEYREMIRKEVLRRKAAGISAPGETPNRPPFIPELNSERRIELIAHRLQKKGHSERVIEQVIGKNWLRLYDQSW
ncbi:MAG: peptidase M19, partial [Shewanella sp.]|nr:peptidase M19 [Shewanella sp.]